MTLAYLVGAAQGLKELASRLCGVRMITYREMVRPGQRSLSLAYLNTAASRTWSDPPPVFETKWDNKKGIVLTRLKKPWHISRKIAGILAAMVDNAEDDPYKRWNDITVVERAEVEVTLGPMPEASLADIKLSDAVQYSVRDADVTLRVKHELSRMISDLGLDFVLHMDLDILPLVDEMMANGMAVDVEHYRRLSADYAKRMRLKAAELAKMVGHPFNPNSSDQVATVVYKELGFKPTGFTPSKEISTDDSELKKTGHPIAKGIIQYRGLSKLKGTYADNMVRSSHPDAYGVPRMHTVIKTTRVATGRLSSSKDENGEGANLQNIPTRNKESKAIKNGFIAPPGYVLAEADYGQVEMCTQADLAVCKGLIELFMRGGDPHTETAARLFDVPLDEAAKDKYRYPCKRAGFGIIYLIGAEGLHSQIVEYIADLEMDGQPVEIEAWDVETCQKFIDDYYKLYPEIRDYQLERAAEARRKGYVRDLFGRIRYIPEVTCPIEAIRSAGFRMAANFPVTATATGIIKLAMSEIWRGLPNTEWYGHAFPQMQIHDSLLDQVAEDESILKPYLLWKKRIMTGVVRLKVPLKVDFKVGKRWGEIKKYELEESKP
jgi:DNA polymerase-1